jgi:hypothetical protein
MRTMRLTTTISAVVFSLATSAAQAEDGYYFTQAVGVGIARGELQPLVGRSIQTRLAVGARVRWLAFEPWIRSDLQLDREGAFKGIVGGEPADGRADLEAYGLDLKLIGPLYRAPTGERVEAYVRGGASYTGGTGMLERHGGVGYGAAAGIQISGKVRALGFLWSPLFFVKRGPKVTGSLYLDQGYDFYRMRDDSGNTVTARVGHVSVGFAVGSGF